MDAISVSLQIERLIKSIDEIRASIRARGDERARAAAEYDKAVTITLIRLKNGEAMELDGHRIQSPPASVMDKLARGMCWQERMKADEADGAYKSAVTNLDAVMAQLNAFQSLFRYQDKI